MDNAGERCELCGTAVAPEAGPGRADTARHAHLVDRERRTLACACRACYLLFTAAGAGGGRYLAVPEEVRYDPGAPLTPADWDDLQVPVGTAFFFHNSDLDRVIACYPSAGGATECDLDPTAWHRIAVAHPLLRALVPDVQAVFAQRTGPGIESYLVPIDRCYALVGEVRLRWRGLDGGTEVRQALNAFLDALRSAARPLPPAAPDHPRTPADPADAAASPAGPAGAVARREGVG